MDDLAAMLDHHWLEQGIETGTAYCTCGEWEFDARVGRHPLPVMGEHFAPFSEHVAAAIAPRLTPDREALRHARAVATVWRDAALRYRDDEFWRPVAHALNLVLAALDGETDPVQLGVDPDELTAARAASQPVPTEPEEADRG